MTDSASAQSLDTAIVAALPEGAKVVSVTRHGNTRWSTGKRIDVEVGGGTKSYFVKIIEVNEYLEAARGEFEGAKAIAAVIPDNTIAPIAWGYFAGDRTKTWYLTEFRHLSEATPPFDQLLAIVLKLHRGSASPNGRFGFHVTPFQGAPPMVVDWSDNWEEFWTRDFRAALAYLERVHGANAELEEVAEEFIGTVVPRLLRPLQTGGRDIKPSLCHGDLFDGNIQIDLDSGNPVIFDPCPFYGHAEMDLQCMRRARYAVGYEFVKLYGKAAASEPKEDFDDRNALYTIRNDILTAGMFPNRTFVLDEAIEDMRWLLAKYPDGIGGFKGDLTPTRTVTGGGQVHVDGLKGLGLY
ncbi:Fructosamine kinase-domain-containing protein [Lasiosphaeria miniovina]|uniref:protein-ribulosamine 3-kinase n=1 Tax=Lasiosphaeria miniovina TaxID=1954250 RepID=A0AA40E4H2_9PEZI|nr:Fructosamine kinase-domain-containing protein [Lasiosphaeria miniovina]KAK0726770.1 Fructosamine kinase-domain-containing protein [Lasiosphaeria miniovina]